MRKLALIIASSVLLLSAHTAKADTWIPYTDGRSGGCWLNKANVLYGCTPQPANSQSGNSSNSPQGCQPQNREEYCLQERQRLKNANESSNRTVTSMRAAEERFARSGCK